MNFKPIVKNIKNNMTMFDWMLIILALITVIGLYTFFRRETKFISARFKVTDENVLYAKSSPRNEYATKFVIGDAERDELGRITSEITGVETYKTSPDTQVVYLDIKVKTIYNPRTKKYSFKGKNIIFGESFDFSFSSLYVRALVVDFPSLSEQAEVVKKKVAVMAQLRYGDRSYTDVYGVPEYLATSVKSGAEVKNSKGETMVKVIDVAAVPAKRLVINAAGRPLLVDDPYLKDVFYTIELNVKEIDGKTYMFDYIPVLIDSIIPINLDNVSVWPTIIEIVQ